MGVPRLLRKTTVSVEYAGDEKIVTHEYQYRLAGRSDDEVRAGWLDITHATLELAADGLCRAGTP